MSFLLSQVFVKPPLPKLVVAVLESEKVTADELRNFFVDLHPMIVNTFPEMNNDKEFEGRLCIHQGYLNTSVTNLVHRRSEPRPHTADWQRQLDRVPGQH